jgi:hypothetical protein
VVAAEPAASTQMPSIALPSAAVLPLLVLDTK